MISLFGICSWLATDTLKRARNYTYNSIFAITVGRLDLSDFDYAILVGLCVRSQFNLSCKMRNTQPHVWVALK